MAQKWILNENQLVLGDVPYHFNLAQDHKTTKGGGRWHFDKETNTLLLYGESSDFGRAKIENLKLAKIDGGFQHQTPPAENELYWLEEVNINFSDELLLNFAIRNCQPIIKLETSKK